MENEKLLKDFTDREKGAYLGAIASLATADHAATEDEIAYMETLADSAELSETQKESVVRAATELSGDELTRCLDVLKTSELRFSLVTDLMAFGKSDSNYSEEEKQNVEKIASYLDINQEQFSLLDQFVDKTADTKPAEQEEVSSPGFLQSLGLEEKFKNAGIDWKTIGKGLIGIAGPLMLAKMMRGRSRGNSMASSGMGGGIGSMLGGGLLSAGLGSLLGGRNSSGGGIGSLISGLSGGRGFGNSSGLLSRILGGFGRR